MGSCHHTHHSNPSQKAQCTWNPELRPPTLFLHVILYTGAGWERLPDYLRKPEGDERRLLRGKTQRCLYSPIEEGLKYNTPLQSTSPPNLSHLVCSFHFQWHVPNCTLHQIVLNGIQTNFYVGPTFPPPPPRFLPPYFHASHNPARDLAPSFCYTSGPHSRWKTETWKMAGRER